MLSFWSKLFFFRARMNTFAFQPKRAWSNSGTSSGSEPMATIRQEENPFSRRLVFKDKRWAILSPKGQSTVTVTVRFLSRSPGRIVDTLLQVFGRQSSPQISRILPSSFQSAGSLPQFGLLSKSRILSSWARGFQASFRINIVHGHIICVNGGF